MDKINCDVVKDLLPLYVDKLTSDGSNKMVEKHLIDCSECKKLYEQMKVPFETELPQVYDKEIDFLKKIRTKMIKNISIGFIGLIVIFGILTWFFAIGTRAKSEDITISTSINEVKTSIEEGIFRLDLTNGKRLEVKVRPIYGTLDNGEKTEIGYVITPYAAQQFPGKDCNNYTIGYPPISNFSITVRFKDKDVVYVMTDKGFVELR